MIRALGQPHHGGAWAAGPASLSGAAPPRTCIPQGPASAPARSGQGERRGPRAGRHWGSNSACLQILGEPMQNRKLVAEISLVNPFAAPLNNCVFLAEGTGLTDGQQIKEL